MRSTNPREVALIFREYARLIHARSVPADPNFLRISIACRKIEQWCEHHYPSFVTLGTGGASSPDPTDARTRIAQHEEKVATQVMRRRRIEAARGPGAKEGPPSRTSRQRISCSTLAASSSSSWRSRYSRSG
ncbi:hypothetical protein DFH11DRAFT_259390 [Phellopilus nigrolimitatus]|nr:hypothetical protein DFH11DRAFT_259390 [Phellopilus nigrolimitatus]